MSDLLSHFYIKLGGSDAPEEFMNDLGNVEVDDNLFLPDMFTIQLRDPRLIWGESDLLAIGQEVEIQAVAAVGVNSQPARIIIGEITSVEPEYPYGGIPTVVVRGYDRSHRLHRGKKTRSFNQVTDSDIVTRIAREYGLQPDVDATTEVYEYIMQSNQTDFEFLMERARRIGFNFLVDDQKLLYKKPGSLPSEVIELEYGITLRQFTPRMSTASQFKEVVVKGWDAVNKQEIIGRADGSSAGSGGGFGGALGGLGGGMGDIGSAAQGLLGSAMEAGGGVLQGYAQEALGYAAGKASEGINAAKSAVTSAIPPELRGVAEYGYQQGMALAEEYLGSEVTGAAKAIMGGDPATIAQVGLDLGSTVVEKAFGEAGTLMVTQHPVRSQAEADNLARAIFEELTAGNLQAEGRANGHPKLTAGNKVKLNGLGNKFGGTYFVTHTRHIYDVEEGYLTEFSISGRSPNTFEDLLFGGAGTNPGMNGNGAPAGVVVGIVTNNNDPQGQGRVKVKFPWLANDQESNWARVVAPMAGADRGLLLLPEVDDEVLVMFEHGDINHPYVLGALWSGTDQPPVSQSSVLSGDGKVDRRVLKTRSGHTVIFDDSEDTPGIEIVDKTGNNKIRIDSANNKLEITIEGEITLKAKGKVNLEADDDITLKSSAGLKMQASANVEIEANGSVKVRGATVELN